MHTVSEVPPLPPADFHARPLAVLEGLDHPLWRIHRTIHDPLFFGPPPGARPTGRWDAPGGQFEVCYLAIGDARIAFAETLLRGAVTVVSEKRLSERSLARFAVVAPLRLALMHGPGLIRMGATAGISSGPHEFSRVWSLALHEHPERPDGIVYRTRHDDDGFGVALFDRAGGSVRLDSTRPLLDPGLRGELGRWLDTYNAALE